MAIWNYQGKPNVITISQAITYAQQAGFTGMGLINAVAIAMAESGLNGNSINDTTSGIGLDRGIVKFNSVFHRDVPDSCAFNPACAFKEFYRVSNQGTNFCEWCTYAAPGQCGKPNCTAGGVYKSNLATVQAAAAGKGISTSSTSTSTSGGTSVSGMLDQVKVWGEYIAIFAIAIILVLVGFFLLSGQSLAS